MGRWIDDLAVEQVDTDDNGTPDATFYPITDLLGSVQLLTDENGAVVQRITYDPDGTPHFWSKDGAQPSVTRIAWTGDGTLPTGDTVTPQAFEIGLSEPIDPASAANATATLTPDGGTPQTLTLTLAADSRTAYLTGATVAAGATYTLHVDGLTDTSHNPMWPEDATVTVADPNAYEVLDDTTAPQLLAVLDGSDALYLLFDEPIEPAAGYDMTTAVSIVRSGQPVDGAATRLTPNLLQWQPAGGVGGLIPGGTYTLSALNLTDLNTNPASASATFTHLNTSDQMLLLAYQAPTDTQPQAQSAYGLTTLFQGRTWHPDLGMYSYRARWYLPEAGEFAERDPVGYGPSPNLQQLLGYSSPNKWDPYGNRGDWDYAPGGKHNRNGSWLGAAPIHTPAQSGGPAHISGDPFGTVGIGVEFFAAAGVPHSPQKGHASDNWLEESFSGAGVLEGADFQFWARPDGSLLGALFLYDNVNGVLTEKWMTGDSGPFGPTGVFGEGASFGIVVNEAVYKGPEPEGHWALSDTKVIQSWAGIFGGLSVAAGPVSIGAFWSPTYTGVSVGMGVGAGGALSITDYRPVWDKVVHMPRLITAIRRFVQETWLGWKFQDVKQMRKSAIELDHKITERVDRFHALLDH